MTQGLHVEQDNAALSLNIGAPFTVTETADYEPAGWQRIHPELRKLPGGRLVLLVSRDRDIPDPEMLIFISDDHGRTWRETVNWPTASERGRHLHTFPVALPDGETLVLDARALFPTGTPGEYLLPSWRSSDGGETWSAVLGAPVTLDTRATPVNLYERPQWYLDLFNGRPNLKPEMPPALEALTDTFGRQRLQFALTDAHVFDDGRVLVFAYVSNMAPGTRGKHETVVIESTDRGQSWRHIATPGAWEDRLNNEFFLKHRTDGLCEPSVTRVGDELLCVMRLGSRHPLYQTRSRDGGHTWSKPAGMPVYGILPAVETLEDGMIALASGRPDVTLSVSIDRGNRWPITYRFLEDGKRCDASTRNNTLLAVGPQRLLYMYDHGGYHDLPDEFEGKRRVVGHFVDITMG